MVKNLLTRTKYLLLVLALMAASFSYLHFFHGFRVTEEVHPEAQFQKVSRDTKELYKKLGFDMGIRDVQWEIFGTPEWAEDGREMWPTDFVSLIAFGKSVKPSMETIFQKEFSFSYTTINSDRNWLPPLFKKTMENLSQGKGVPHGVRCRVIEKPPNNQHEGGVSCTDGESVIYFISLESHA